MRDFDDIQSFRIPKVLTRSHKSCANQVWPISCDLFISYCFGLVNSFVFLLSRRFLCQECKLKGIIIISQSVPRVLVIMGDKKVKVCWSNRGLLYLFLEGVQIKVLNSCDALPDSQDWDESTPPVALMPA